MKTAPRVFAWFLAGLCLTAIPLSMARASGSGPGPITINTTVVRSADLDSGPAATARLNSSPKWFMYNDSTDAIDNTLGTFVTGPATPAQGVGSIEFTLGASPMDRKNIATYRFAGMSLSSITSMSYGEYSHSGVAGANEAPYVAFNVDLKGDNTWQKRLVYVPSQNGSVVQDSWQTWEVVNNGAALWTWSGYYGNGNKWPDGNTSEYRTWNDIKAAYPNARILPSDGWLGVRVGEPGPTGYTGDVDFFSITSNNVKNVFDFEPNPPFVKVTIEKFINGETPGDITDTFPMTASWSADNIGAGSGSFSLGPDGFNSSYPYTAVTADMTTGASYSVAENEPASCDADNAYRLDGYTVGATRDEAETATKTTTPPSFTNMTEDQYVIVWNVPCPPATMLKVHILKYLDGAEATAQSAGGYMFPMTADWQTANLNGGAETTGTYVLGNNHGGAASQYGADTAPMQAPANYATAEITDSTSNVLPADAACVPGKYQLVGYTTSPTSFANAATMTPSPTLTPFTSLSADQYVIVWNKTCPTKGSLTIEKDAVGGNGTFTFSGDMGTFTLTTVGGVASKTFSDLAPGTYHVTEASKSGWTMTENECSSVTVNGGDDIVCHITNTSNRLLGQIRGTKYEDRDGDGSLKDGDHHRLSGWTIYLDTNNNGQLDTGEPSTVTDSHGGYRFLGLTAGTYHVREVGQSGWVETYPASGKYDITLAAGQIAKKKDFGNFKLGTISGMKFYDKNGNGRKDKDEAGLSGWTIQLIKVGGPTITTTTDQNGNYSFTGVGPGTYRLREVAQSGWVQSTKNPKDVTLMSGMNSTHNDFGNRHPQDGHPNNGHDDNGWPWHWPWHWDD